MTGRRAPGALGGSGDTANVCAGHARLGGGVPQRDAQLIALSTEIGGGSGAPVRAVAILPAAR